MAGIGHKADRVAWRASQGVAGGYNPGRAPGKP
jgi:hypothetical protein